METEDQAAIAGSKTTQRQPNEGAIRPPRKGHDTVSEHKTVEHKSNYEGRI